MASVISGLRWTTAQLTLQKEELSECFFVEILVKGVYCGNLNI